MNKVNPLQTGRFYRVKNPKRKFLCALCSAPRQVKYSKNLTGKNFAQIIILSLFLGWAFFPLMGAKSMTLLFPVWMLVEISNKMLYRKEIPCPYCGFDATWYRRDVNVANTKVKEFWDTNFPELVKSAKENQANDENIQIVPEVGAHGNEASSHSEAI